MWKGNTKVFTVSTLFYVKTPQRKSKNFDSRKRIPLSCTIKYLNIPTQWNSVPKYIERESENLLQKQNKKPLYPFAYESRKIF